jgi:tRNA G26 N,N-dimethylase Trm1
LRNGEFLYLDGYRSIEKILVTCVTEDDLPPGGYDVNETSSYLKCSPPSMEHIEMKLRQMGYGFSRSRFSPTIVKTDAPTDEFEACFDGEEGS